jgi:hypothetical protein
VGLQPPSKGERQGNDGCDGREANWLTHDGKRRMRDLSDTQQSNIVKDFSAR